jgi:plasmid stabilization system protein ParE
MYKLRLRPLAKKDIQGIVDYYDEINPGLSDMFLEDWIRLFSIL